MDLSWENKSCHSLTQWLCSFTASGMYLLSLPWFQNFENWICNNAKFHSRRKSFQACKLLHSSSVNAFPFCRSAVIFCSDYRAGKLSSCYIYIHYGLWSSIVQLKTAEIQLLKALPREMPMSRFYTQPKFMLFKTYVHKQLLLDHVMQVVLINWFLSACLAHFTRVCFCWQNYPSTEGCNKESLMQ